MQNRSFFITIGVFWVVLICSCSKDPQIQTIGSWQNSENLARGYLNDTPWEGTLEIKSDGTTLNIAIARYDGPDSLLVNYLKILNVPPSVGKYELHPYSFLTKKVFSTFSLGDGDVFDDFDILDLPTETNELIITKFDLKSGIFTGKINATYTYYNGPFHTKENIYIKDLVFNYQR